MMSLSRLIVSLLVASESAAVLAAALPGDRDVAAGSDIFGGTQSTPGSFPGFVVALIVNGGQKCGGVLLNSRTVVTAAHCAWEGLQDPSWWRVHAGSLSWDHGGFDVGVSSIVYHPKYKDSQLDNDISVWHLSAPINQSPSISYANLPAQGSDPPAGASITTAGWGSTNATLGDAPEYLHQITYPVVSRETCRATVYKGERVKEDMFCAGTPQGDRTFCFGDSGGPAVDAGSPDTVWGLVSWRPRHVCGGPEYPYDVYVRVGLFVDWIKENML